MDYDALTVQHRIDLLRERLLNYEALHFQQVCELELATEHELESVMVSAQAAMAGFKRSIEWCKVEIEKLEASKTA